MSQIFRAAEKTGQPPQLDLPGLPVGTYMVEAMMVIGPTRSNGMAEVPTDWDIILPFASATGRITECWEFELLADMCLEYFNAKIEGENPLSISPVERKTEIK